MINGLNQPADICTFFEIPGGQQTQHRDTGNASGTHELDSADARASNQGGLPVDALLAHDSVKMQSLVDEA